MYCLNEFPECFCLFSSNLMHTSLTVNSFVSSVDLQGRTSTHLIHDLDRNYANGENPNDHIY